MKNTTCDICEKEKAVRVILSVNYCQSCYADYLAAVRRAGSPYITREDAGRIKTVHFPDSQFVMAFICQPNGLLSDEECIQIAIAKKLVFENMPLQGSGKDEREEMNSD